MNEAQAGFTLPEILLSIAVIAVLAGLAVPVQRVLQERTDADTALFSFAASARRAQTLSRSQYLDSSWGVHMATGTITMFRGGSYAGRVQSYDEITAISSALEIAGVNEVVYTSFTGLPSTTGTTTLTLPSSDTRNFHINAQGTITY